MPLITCQNVSIAYENNIAVTDLTFEVNNGDYICIVGENGSGKSTLIKGLLGLKQPIKGTIMTGDGLKPAEVGYLPQQTNIQRDFPASVYEVVLSGCLNSIGWRPFYTKQHKQTANDNIKLLGLDNLSKKCYRELSGGQQQRVLLARALCATKKLLLLDEPASGLDPVVTAELYKIIKMLNKEYGITIIMVSHDIKSAVDNSTHILHMHNKTLFYGKTQDYLKSETAKKFLGGEQSA